MAFDLAHPGDPAAWLRQNAVQEPVFFFRPQVLATTARRFLRGFPGLVTYAVKANPDAAVLSVLDKAGLRAFDVASPQEMAAVRAIAPDAVLHYHNPVRSKAEIAAARRFAVASWSVDRMSELDKIGPLEGQEVAVRLRLPLDGAAYDFGLKFGADPDAAVALLRAVQQRGGRVSMTFHPGTQCENPAAWAHYIRACQAIAAQAGVALERLNVGGGFPAWRGEQAPDLDAVFKTIHEATHSAFGDAAPALVCEPGRAMVSASICLLLTVKAISDDAVFLDDGLYGGLADWRDMPAPARIAVLRPDGAARGGSLTRRRVFGPTCDSLDALPAPLALPVALAEGDHLLIPGMGAYAQSLATRFNGYGARRCVVLGGTGPDGP